MNSARNSEAIIRSRKNLDTLVCSGESGNVQSGCSVKAIHDIISRFDERKRELVESIGFGGLLKFPPLKSTNRKFSAWLMGRVNFIDSSLYLEDGSTLKFYSDDVSLVFGIPGSGKNICEAAQVEKDEKDKVKHQCWPNTVKDNQSIKAVEELVDSTYEHPMTPEQENTFKVAFVVFVMSTLFVPGAKHDYACVDYWGTLTNPSTIQEYDWAAYIHKKLLTAANKYKSDVAKGSRAPIITGCYLFLQVFYLDNMNIPVWGMDHNEQPRIAVFTYERIRNMISADTRDRTDVKSGCVYGKSKVRAREQSCYTWASSEMDQPMDSYTKGASSLWQSVLSLITILKLPLEAAGPLFMAVSELNRPSEACNPPSPIECIAILLKILEPFRNGFNYNFDIHQYDPGLEAEDSDCKIPEIILRYCAATECNKGVNNRFSYKNGASSSGHHTTSTDDLGNTVRQSSNNFECVDVAASKKPRLSMPNSVAENIACARQPKAGGIDYSVIKLMSRFYLMLRSARERNRIDLNTESFESFGCCNTATDGELYRVGAAITPWELGETWGCNSADNHGLPANEVGCADTSNSSSSEMPRIVDYHPKYIEVMPEPARDQRVGFAELDMDMFDAIIRCFKRSDDALYNAEGRLRWRHYFESDILAAVLAGWFDINNPSMTNQFIGSHLAYDIFNCSMLFFPVILHERWVCFSWNLRDNRIVVSDPACLNIPEFSVRSTYKVVADKLKKSVSTTIPVLFPNWKHDWGAASVVPFHWRAAGIQCSNRTGVLTAYFCRCFDGKKLRPEITQEQTERIAMKLFDEVKVLHTARVCPGPSSI